MFATIHVKSPTAPMPGHLDARQFLRHVGCPSPVEEGPAFLLKHNEEAGPRGVAT